MKPFLKNIPVIIGDSGGVPEIPANTAESFAEAFKLGADAVSFSICCTKDMCPLIAPSFELGDFTTGKGKIPNMLYAELSGITIPQPDDTGKQTFNLFTLAEAFQLFPDKKFIISLLDEKLSCADAVISLVRQFSAEQRVLLGSPNGRIINRFRKELPDCATSFSIMSIVGIYSLFRSGLIAFRNSFNGDALVTPENIGTSYIANGAMIHAMHERGIPVFVRTADTDMTINRALESGADGIITGNIPELIAISARFRK